MSAQGGAAARRSVTGGRFDSGVVRARHSHRLLAWRGQGWRACSETEARAKLLDRAGHPRTTSVGATACHQGEPHSECTTSAHGTFAAPQITYGLRTVRVL